MEFFTFIYHTSTQNVLDFEPFDCSHFKGEMLNLNVNEGLWGGQKDHLQTQVFICNLFFFFFQLALYSFRTGWSLEAPGM